MPSFDIVSKIDVQEMDNAINQAKKEIVTRYDFRGSKSKIDWDREKIDVLADDDFKMKAILDIIKEKTVRRNIDPKVLDIGKTEDAMGGFKKCLIKIKQGIPIETAKEMVKEVNNSKLKVQAQIQEDQLRITGKKRDDLQEAIALFKSKT